MDRRIPGFTDRSLLGFGMPRIPGPENGPPRRALAVGNDPGNGIRLDNARATRDAQVHPSSSAFPLSSRLTLPAASSCPPPVRCTCRYPRSLDPPQTHKFSPSARFPLLPSVTARLGLHGNRSEIRAPAFSASSLNREEQVHCKDIATMYLPPMYRLRSHPRHSRHVTD